MPLPEVIQEAHPIRGIAETNEPEAHSNRTGFIIVNAHHLAVHSNASRVPRGGVARQPQIDANVLGRFERLIQFDSQPSLAHVVRVALGHDILAVQVAMDEDARVHRRERESLVLAPIPLCTGHGASLRESVSPHGQEYRPLQVDA
jgi:hypothetical protein